MSKASTPTLPWVIPCYKRMDEALRKSIEDESLPMELRRAAGGDLVRLKIYHSAAMNNHYNIIATGMYFDSIFTFSY